MFINKVIDLNLSAKIALIHENHFNSFIQDLFKKNRYIVQIVELSNLTSRLT